MPASEASLEQTERYRAQVKAERAKAAAAIVASWGILSDEDLDGSYRRWLAAGVAIVLASQHAGASYGNAYVAGYIGAEIGREAAATIDPTGFGGLDRFGRPLARALTPPLMTIKMAIAGGLAFEQAIRHGLQRALRIGSESVSTAAGTALAALMRQEPRITGWRRAANLPSCGACLAAANGRVQALDADFRAHIGCDCVMEPEVAGASQRIRRPTGPELFWSLPRDEQDALFEGRGGEAKAELLRSGAIDFEDLISTDPRRLGPDGITETPLAELVR